MSYLDSTTGGSGGDSFWQDDGNNNISNINTGGVSVGTTNHAAKLHVTGVLTIEQTPPTDAAAVIVYDEGGDHIADGSTRTYRIYTYNFSVNPSVYSSTYEEVTVTDDNSARNYKVNLTWTYGSFLAVKVLRDVNGGGYIVGKTASIFGSMSDTDDISWVAGTEVTPTSYETGALLIDGASRFLDDLVVASGAALITEGQEAYFGTNSNDVLFYFGNTGGDRLVLDVDPSSGVFGFTDDDFEFYQTLWVGDITGQDNDADTFLIEASAASPRDIKITSNNGSIGKSVIIQDTLKVANYTDAAEYTFFSMGLDGKATWGIETAAGTRGYELDGDASYFLPGNTNTTDLGAELSQWHDIWMAGQFFYTGSFAGGYVMADELTGEWTAGHTIDPEALGLTPTWYSQVSQLGFYWDSAGANGQAFSAENEQEAGLFGLAGGVARGSGQAPWFGSGNGQTAGGYVYNTISGTQIFLAEYASNGPDIGLHIFPGNVTDGIFIDTISYAPGVTTGLNTNLFTAKSREAMAAYISPAVFTGTGLDDMTLGGSYFGSPASFRVEITAEGTPDLFTYSVNGSPFFIDEPITGAAQTMTNGIEVTFAADTGHTLGDYWEFTGTGGSSFTGVFYRALDSANTELFKVNAPGHGFFGSNAVEVGRDGQYSYIRMTEDNEADSIFLYYDAGGLHLRQSSLSGADSENLYLGTLNVKSTGTTNSLSIDTDGVATYSISGTLPEHHFVASGEDITTASTILERDLFSILAEPSGTISSASADTVVDYVVLRPTFDVSNIVLGDTSTSNPILVAARGSRFTVSGDVELNDTVQQAQHSFIAQGALFTSYVTFTATSLAATTSIISTAGTFIDNTTSPDVASRTHSATGISGHTSSNLGTNGTTTHTGGDFSGTGTADVNHGIFANASGATTNWAGYFQDGNVKIENVLEVDKGITVATAATTAGNVGGVIFNHFASVGNIGTLEDDLFSNTLPANTFGLDGDKVVATYGGVFNGAVTTTQTLKAYFGGTLIYNSGELAIGAATSNWTLNVVLIRESSTVVRANVSVNTDFATLFPYSTYTRVTGLTLSGTNILKLTGETAGAAAATDQVVATMGYGKREPAA